MKKKIKVENLKEGMHLSEICGSWLDHPFWKKEFILKEHDIQLLRKSSVTEVWVDAIKGIDPEKFSTQTISEEEQQIKTTEDFKQLDKQVLEQRQVVFHFPTERTTLSQEAKKARNIVKRAGHKINQLFNEARMGKILSESVALELVEEISNSVFRNSDALISIARLKTKDNYTYMHSVAVCALMVSLAKCLGYDPEFCKKAGMAGLYHDIGKMFIPLEILNKPSKLTAQEFDVIKGHPLKGWELLKQSSEISVETLDVCLHHHEKIDGSGYPHGIKTEELSVFAKMGSICDAYDAVTSDRPYKKGWEPSESIQHMAEWTGHFDPIIFRAFVKSIGIYPVGSLVKLASGKIGVVIEKGTKSLLSPKIKIFFSTKSNCRITPEIIDLARPGIKEKIESRENFADYKFGDITDMWLT